VKSLKLMSSGLTPLILLSVFVSGGAYFARCEIAKRSEAELKKAQQAVATVPVMQADFEVVVNSTGRLEAVKSLPVMCDVTGQVVRVVPNGTQVKKGDVILELDAKRIARSLRDSKNQYDDAARRLEQLKRDLAADVKKAEFALAQAQKDLAQFQAQQEADLTNRRKQSEFDAKDLDLARDRLARKQRQAEANLTPKQEVELAIADIRAKEYGLERQAKDTELAERKAESDLIDKRATLQKAEADLARAKAAEQDEVQNATMELQINEQQMARSKDQLSKAIIRAPAAGILALEPTGDRFGGGSQRPLGVGDPLYEGRKVATIPNLSEMRVALELTQDQVRLVRKKQKAEVQVEGLPGAVFNGEVVEIAQAAKEQNMSGGFIPTGERVFQTYISLKNPKKVYLRPGTTAAVRLIVDQVPKAMSIPIESIFSREGESIVYVQRGGEFVPAKVTLGPQNDDVVVVRKGLKAGDHVALHEVRETGTEGGAGAPAGSSALLF